MVTAGLVIVVAVALAFDFFNGFHDAANSIATVVSTRVLTPAIAVLWAAFFNFVAFLVFGTKVAATIAKDVVDPHVLTLGVGWRLGRLRLDATYGHVFMADGNVPKGTSCVAQIDPIRTGDDSGMCVHDDAHTYVGDGTYRSAWDIFGVGATVDF